MLTHLLYLLKALQSAVTHFLWQVGGGLSAVTLTTLDLVG